MKILEGLVILCLFFVIIIMAYITVLVVPNNFVYMDTITTIMNDVNNLVSPVEPFDEIVYINIDKFVDGSIDSEWVYIKIVVRDIATNNIEHDYFEYNTKNNKLFGEKNIVTWK